MRPWESVPVQAGVAAAAKLGGRLGQARQARVAKNLTVALEDDYLASSSLLSAMLAALGNVSQGARRERHRIRVRRLTMPACPNRAWTSAGAWLNIDDVGSVCKDRGPQPRESQPCVFRDAWRRSAGG